MKKLLGKYHKKHPMHWILSNVRGAVPYKLDGFDIYSPTLHPSAQTTNKPLPTSRLTRPALPRHSLGLGCC